MNLQNNIICAYNYHVISLAILLCHKWGHRWGREWGSAISTPLASAQYSCAFRAHKWVSEVYFFFYKNLEQPFFIRVRLFACTRHGMMLLLVSKLPAKSIYHSSVPLAPTRIKKKNPALRAEKTGLACEYINGNDNGKILCTLYLVTLSLILCHLVLRMVFPLVERGFSFCRITAL
jgi:hypothetical protein